MKKIFSFILIISIICCACKKDTKIVRPSKLYINGLVTDKLTAISIDSVSVSLNYSTNSIGSPSIPQLTFYTGKDGKFNFQFSPKDNYTYDIAFDKTSSGYKWTHKYIDLDKEYQEFNIALEK